eukprot:scaffold101_cov373-Prasinococcus_capsulatus_cf.AAC.18
MLPELRGPSGTLRAPPLRSCAGPECRAGSGGRRPCTPASASATLPRGPPSRSTAGARDECLRPSMHAAEAPPSPLLMAATAAAAVVAGKGGGPPGGQNGNGGGIPVAGRARPAPRYWNGAGRGQAVGARPAHFARATAEFENGARGALDRCCCCCCCCCRPVRVHTYRPPGRPPSLTSPPGTPRSVAAEVRAPLPSALERGWSFGLTEDDVERTAC